MAFNAIANAQVRLRGGMKNIFWSSLAYLAALSVGIAVIYGSTLPKYRPEAFDAMMSGLVALQAMVFFFYGLFSIAAGVKGDLNGGMIESHRLMPISSGSAVMGYLMGAPAQAYALFVINFFLGLVMYILVPRIWVRQDQWILYNGMLLALGIFFFAIGIFWNMLGRNVGRYLIGFLLLYWFSRGNLLSLLPGLMLLFAPALWTFRTMPPTWVFVTAGGAELVIAVILLVAAAHKYRWPGRPAFTREMALLLMAAMATVFAVGINLWSTVNNFSWWYDREVSLGTQFVCSMSVVAWLGMIAALSASKYSANLGSGLAAAIGATVITCVLFIVAPMHSWGMLAETALVVLIFELTLLFLLRFMYGRSQRGAIWTFAILMVMWFVPFVADGVRYSANAQDGVPQWTRLATLSPYGAMFLIWKMRDYSVAPGIVFQGIVLGLAIMLYGFFSRKADVGSSGTARPSSPQAEVPPPVGRGGEFLP